jgi:hypothetical protein
VADVLQGGGAQCGDGLLARLPALELPRRLHPVGRVHGRSHDADYLAAVVDHGRVVGVEGDPAQLDQRAEALSGQRAADVVLDRALVGVGIEDRRAGVRRRGWQRVQAAALDEGDPALGRPVVGVRQVQVRQAQQLGLLAEQHPRQCGVDAQVARRIGVEQGHAHGGGTESVERQVIEGLYIHARRNCAPFLRP